MDCDKIRKSGQCDSASVDTDTKKDCCPQLPEQAQSAFLKYAVPGLAAIVGSGTATAIGYCTVKKIQEVGFNWLVDFCCALWPAGQQHQADVEAQLPLRAIEAAEAPQNANNDHIVVQEVAEEDPENIDDNRTVSSGPLTVYSEGHFERRETLRSADLISYDGSNASFHTVRED